MYGRFAVRKCKAGLEKRRHGVGVPIASKRFHRRPLAKLDQTITVVKGKKHVIPYRNARQYNGMHWEVRSSIELENRSRRHRANCLLLRCDLVQTWVQLVLLQLMYFPLDYDAVGSFLWLQVVYRDQVWRFTVDGLNRGQ